MRIGKAYLVHCGDWHTFVGRVTEQIAPGIYEMWPVSKIAETNNGDCWEAMAGGDAKLRGAANYKHGKTPHVIPLTIAAMEWVGELPWKE